MNWTEYVGVVTIDILLNTDTWLLKLAKLSVPNQTPLRSNLVFEGGGYYAVQYYTQLGLALQNSAD